jgi:hypothetical protein
MATYFKYAERSADSQVNWAEIGKNMTDMLREENRLREDKKAAIDAASREFGETLANAPQGEHKGNNQWALEYADSASQYMLMQDRLLKQGLLKPKDYMIARQNIMDGTKQAFNLSKEFQSTYAKKMERYKKGESQDLELWLNAQAEKFGDFTKSQLYINPTNGTVSVAMKERQEVDGKEVFVMNKNPNEFATINSLRNSIAGTYDKYDTNAVTTAFAESVGKEKTSTIVFGTLSKGGSITTIEDITSRTDLDADGKTVMFKFLDAENQMITAALENPYNRLSVLTNTKKFAPNGKQYTFTYDEADAKANPEKVLIKIDPASGQPTPEFNDEQMKVSNEAMRTEVRAKYNYEKAISATGQAQRQDEPEWKTKQKAADEEAAAAAGAWNQLYTGKTAADKRAATEILLGTPIAQEAGLLDIDMRTPGEIRLKYVDSAKNRTITYLDANGNPISLRDFSGKGVELHGVVDRDKAVRAGGGGTGFGKVGAEELSTVRANRQGIETPAAPFSVPLGSIIEESGNAVKILEKALPEGFKVRDLANFGVFGNDVEIEASNGEKYRYTAKKSAAEAEKIKKDIDAFVMANQGKGTAATGGEVNYGDK